MNPNMVADFWAHTPPEMKLIIGLFLGATLHFVRNRALPIAEGLFGAISSIIAGLIFTLLVCYIKGWSYGDLWYISGIVAFMANYILGGMETIGKQIRDTPIRFLIDTALDAYDQIKERLKSKE